MHDFIHGLWSENFGLKEMQAVADPGFSPGGVPTPKVGVQTYFLAENCMKMKEFWPPGGNTSLAPPLDLPLAR